MSTTRNELLHALDLLLAPERFKDYGPNGLQVEGRTTVRKIVSGVTASRALIEAAIRAEADAIFVHHGLFWRGQDRRVTGWMKQRLGLLLGDDVNLFAYHLPLDAHPELGNNAQLGLQLGLVAHAGSTGRFGEQEIGFLGVREDGSDFKNGKALAAHVEKVLEKAGNGRGYCEARYQKHSMVHRRRPGLLRSRDRGRGRCFHHRRDLRAADPLRARTRRGLPGLRPPRDRALRSARRGRPCRCAAGAGARIHRHRQPLA